MSQSVNLSLVRRWTGSHATSSQTKTSGTSAAGLMFWMIIPPSPLISLFISFPLSPSPSIPLQEATSPYGGGSVWEVIMCDPSTPTWPFPRYPADWSQHSWDCVLPCVALLELLLSCAQFWQRPDSWPPACSNCPVSSSVQWQVCSLLRTSTWAPV